MVMSSKSFQHVNDHTVIILVQHGFSHCNVNKIIDWLIIVQRQLTDILSPIFSRVRVVRSLVSCVVFCSSLYIFFLCPLYCLTFFDWWLLISALIPSNFSYTFREQFNKQNIRNYVNRFVLLALWWRQSNSLITGAMPSWAMGSLFSRWWSHGEWVENLSYDGLWLTSWFFALEWLRE